MTIEFEQWFDEFRPRKNKVATDRPYNNYMWETHSPDIDYLRDSNISNFYYWTLIDCENEEQYIIPGYHLVNRAGHFLTEKPWENEDLQVNLNEMITIGAAKYACIEFLEMLGIPEEQYEDIIHDYFSQKF